MTKFHRMVSELPPAQIVEQDPTPWLLLVPVVALDIALFASVHLNETLWQVVRYAATHLLVVG